jgi:hypothetical protein
MVERKGTSSKEEEKKEKKTVVSTQPSFRSTIFEFLASRIRSSYRRRRARRFSARFA